jgi:hypothetical protein
MEAVRSTGSLCDLVNVPTLLFVAICFFLPLTKMSCGPIEISFSGLNMALGTAPHVNAPTPQDRQQAGREIAEKGFRKSPLLLLVPAAAVIGALLSFVAMRARADGVRSVALAAGPALVTLLLAYYWLAGFGVEREFAEEMARQRESDPFQAAATMKKTGWFYAALIASMAALVLAVARVYSPRLVIGSDGVLRLQFATGLAGAASSPAGAPALRGSAASVQSEGPDDSPEGAGRY